VLHDAARQESPALKRERTSRAPKSVVVMAVFAADLPETVGGKVLEYWLRAGYYRDLSEPF
jgi:hypothetical protein